MMQCYTYAVLPISLINNSFAISLVDSKRLSRLEAVTPSQRNQEVFLILHCQNLEGCLMCTLPVVVEIFFKIHPNYN